MKRFSFKDLFLINKFSGPYLVTIVYWILCLTFIILAIGSYISPELTTPESPVDMFVEPPPPPEPSLFKSIMILVFGLLFSRLWAEIVGVPFHIYRNSQITAKNTEIIAKYLAQQSTQSTQSTQSIQSTQQQES